MIGIMGSRHRDAVLLDVGAGQMAHSWGISEAIALVSAIIAFGAMVIAIWQACYAKRQTDAALGEVEPLVFLDSRAFENAQCLGGRASLTLVNQNRRDIRLIEIEVRTDPAILVSVDTGEIRDIITATYKHGRKDEGAPLIIDLRDKHQLIQGSQLEWLARG
jgi:hypothetical protein